VVREITKTVDFKKARRAEKSADTFDSRRREVQEGLEGKRGKSGEIFDEKSCEGSRGKVFSEVKETWGQTGR